MKDLTTGLSIAPLSHFPTALLEAVLRTPTSAAAAAAVAAPPVATASAPLPQPPDAAAGNHAVPDAAAAAAAPAANAGTPLVFFAEMLFKLSAGALRRGEKPRLVLITPESINVYDDEGFMKRRLRISDVVAVYHTAEQRDYFGTVATAKARAARRQQQQHKQRGDHSDAEPATSFASVGLVLVGGYDIAFDIVATGPLARAPAVVAQHLVRVVGVLQRRNAKLARELVVVRHAAPGAVGVPPARDGAAFANLFFLKKPQRGAPPLIPPTLEVVSEEAEKQKSLDAKLQVDEAITDLSNELAKYAREHWAARGADTAARLNALAASQRECARLQAEQRQLERTRQDLAASNERRGTRVAAELAVARRQLHEAIVRAGQLRRDHDATIGEVREAIDAAEERAGALVQQQLAARDMHIERLQAVEQRCADLRRERADVASALDARSGLPSLPALRGEIEAVREAVDTVRADVEALRAADGTGTDLASAEAALREENAELEQDVLAARSAEREVDEVQKQLLFQRSTLEAKRQRLRASCVERERAIAALRCECADREALLRETRTLHELQLLTRDTLEAEATVCSDIERERAIHDSIASSVAHVAIAAAGDELEEQRSLAATLQSLRELRVDLMSRSGTPRTPHGAYGAAATPRSEGSRRGAPAAATSGPQPRRAVFRDPQHGSPRAPRI